MNKHSLFIFLTAGLLSITFPQSSYGQDGEDSGDQNDVNSVTIVLTKLDVNEPIITPRVNNQRLELSWKIRNNTDHDVWVLVSQTPEKNYVYDVFMDSDSKTLVLRRRFNLPEGEGWEHLPRARYVRLRPDQEITESVSIALPVKPRTVFDRLLGNAEFAKRLTVEIGYYDEDLPGLILDIAEMAEELNCDIGLDSPIHDPYDMEVRRRFFGGVFVARFFYLESFEYFRNSVTSGGDEVFIPYMWQTLDGEKVLRVEVDNVSIPYESNYPPLTDGLTPSETEPAGVTTVLAKFDVNDTNLKMGFKIINNTDHDIWLCDRYVDTFMEADNRTLVLRTRYNLSKEGVMWEFPFPRFRYSRLRTGQEKVESYSLGFPVKPDALFKTSQGNAEYAKRLAVEIGFYDEDLPELILDIAEMAEQLSCDTSLQSIASPPLDANNDRMELSRRFFAGVFIARFYNLESFTYFRDSVTGGSDEIIAPYLWQTLDGERVLRIEVDNVSIPYESNYPPLND